MKQFLKKTNRGLWLGAILLAALAIFISVHQVRNAAENRGLERFAGEYAESLLQIGCTGERNYMQESEKVRQSEALEALIAKDWSIDAEISPRNSWIDADGLRKRLKLWQDSAGYAVTELSLPEGRQIIVQREGDGNAYIYVYLTGVVATVKGDCKATDYRGILFPEVPAPGGQSVNRSFVINLQISLKLIRRGGKWKITSMYFSNSIAGTAGQYTTVGSAQKGESTEKIVPGTAATEKSEEEIGTNVGS